MLDSIYIGATGLINYSKGLSNISDNVANLNTAGFKGTQLEFLDLFYRYSYSGSNDQQSTPYAQGSGVKAGQTSLRFTQGDFRQTGNDLDLAIDGNGLFVVRKDGQTFYTRDGEFTFDDSGYLVSRSDGARVAAQSGGSFSDINITGKRSNPAKPTTEVKFTNSLSVGGSTYTVSNISVYDSLGVLHTMSMDFTNNSSTTPGSWLYTLKEGSGTIASGEVRYFGSGTPQPGFETSSFVFTPSNGANPQTVTLDFTDTNSFSSSSSTLSVESQNGYAAGFLSKATIDTDGNVVLNYSNGQTSKDQRLALAWFDNINALKAEGGNRYTVAGDAQRIVGSPGESVFGALKTGGIELSNVDLSQEFSELIIVQRGYQAASQVISAANEMIQQLGDLGKGSR